MCIYICGDQRSISSCLFPPLSTCFCYYHCLLSSEAESLIFTWSSLIWLVRPSSESQIYPFQLLRCYNCEFKTTSAGFYLGSVFSPILNLSLKSTFQAPTIPPPSYFSTTKNLKQRCWMGIPKWANLPFFEARKTDVCASVKSNCPAVTDTGRTAISLLTDRTKDLWQGILWQTSGHLIILW